MAEEEKDISQSSHAEAFGANGRNAPAGAAPSNHNIPISGRFGTYDSSFWKAALAVTPIRYLFRVFFRGGWEASGNALKAERPINFYGKQAYAVSAGLGMEGVAGFFALQTWKDMRSIFSQSLAWELDKDAKDINFADFKKSHNTIVQQTISNYGYRNTLRIAVNSLFFLPVVAGAIFKKFDLFKESKWLNPNRWHPEAGVDLGLSANAAYLFHDVLVRKMSAFESLQNIIDRKINQTDNPGDVIEVTDLLDIYERNAAIGKINSFLKHRGTPQWDESLTIFTRMTDLMNQTYKNVAPREPADFGMPHFIYMAGNNLIHPEKVEQTLAYIEVANRYGIPALKEMVRSMEEGVPLAEALRPYPAAEMPVRAQGEQRKSSMRAEIMPKRAIQPVSLMEQASRAEFGPAI